MVADGTNRRFDLAAALPDVADLRRLHFMAVAGRGVSGVARLALQQGLEVSGSDGKDLPVLADLRAAGAEVTVGYRPETAQRLPEGTTLVVSSHIRDDNPELVAARERGLRILHRSQGLAVLAASARPLAVAGASGKTTTSAMAASALIDLGLDPSYAVGDDLAATHANAGHGEGDVFVVEADESDGSFVVYHSEIAIVTNVAPDHLDFYGSFDNVRRAYAQFAATIRPGGLLVVCADDAGSAELGRVHAARGGRIVTYGTAEGADVHLTGIGPDAGRWAADIRVGEWSGRLTVPVPGDHNILNAAGVLAALVHGLGLDPEGVVAALGRFPGVRRRYELRGEAGGVTVIDDYAHNADKVRALVRTARVVAGERRLVVLFQPHLFSRTRDFAPEFAQALAPADEVLLMDVYPAREEPIPGVTSHLVADAPALAGRVRVLEGDHDTVLDAVLRILRPGDYLVLVGAGDVSDLAPRLLAALETGA